MTNKPLREVNKKKSVDFFTDKLKINYLFSYELAPIPASVFKDTGEENHIPHQKMI